MPTGTVGNLLKTDNKEKLNRILLLHVVPRPVFAPDVAKLSEAKTVGGKTIHISNDDRAKVETAAGMANTTKTDIKTSNGVIHVIDAIILP